MKTIAIISQKIIEFSYYLLFLLVPLVFNKESFELFEYNKMMLTYAFTLVILTAWMIKMAADKKIEIKKTPFDIFLLLFLISQVLSTVFSMDVHVSIFGYYSRFHQGLLATVSYIILYFAFTSNFPREKIKNISYFAITSAFIVSVWGILEHLGISPSCYIIYNQIGVDCWVQDVKTRVFATLGQPNWMSAYLAIIIPITIGIGLESITKTKKIAFQSIFFIALSVVFFVAFLYTRSRSGFSALALGLITFLLLLIKKSSPKVRQMSLASLIIFSLCVFIAGSGIAQIDRFTMNGLLGGGKQSEARLDSPEVSIIPALEGGGTESGTIRAIVWKGALDIFRRYPLFGSGVETFAYSYNQYRPIAHNMVSEWDFLYNKAHNEYLNFLATTGIVGFLTYMSFILAFIIWFFKNGANQNLLNLALLCGWLTILITNFFGFSVVIVALYLYLIPAVIFITNEDNVIASKVPSLSRGKAKQSHPFYNFPTGLLQSFHSFAMTIFACLFFLFSSYTLINYYQADTDYAKGSALSKNGQYKEAYLFLTGAIEKNPLEPVYHDEISNTLSGLAVSFSTSKDLDSAEKFASLALKESGIATTISPNNVTFYKSKTKMFYTLSQLDQAFIPRAVDALKKAQELSPTDPKILYNLAVLQSKTNELAPAIALLEKAVGLKPDYRDTRYALALLYKDNGQLNKATEQLEYILKNINPSDSEAKDKLSSWGYKL